MRKITSEAVRAFLNGENYKNGNTMVTKQDYFLHGNKIAERTESGGIRITLAGWNTNTTRERLNGLPNVKVTTKKEQVYLNGKEWDGDWITV